MIEELLTGASPRATELLIEEWMAHVNATDVLDDLTPEQATTKLEGWPYSIAEQEAHMLFWQRHTHQAIENRVSIHLQSENEQSDEILVTA